MTTAEIINQAVKMINEHDFFWFYADYEAAAREAARGHMVAFVELINKVSTEVRKALKGLWMARYEWAKKNMFGSLDNSNGFIDGSLIFINIITEY